VNEIAADIRFSIIPEWVLDADISEKALKIYAILARYADSETLQAFPSRETLARRARCHPKSVTRAIDELVAIGAVIKQHRKSGEAYQSNLYTLRRVGPTLSLPRDTGVTTLGTPVSPPRDTRVPLTRTTERKPKEPYRKTLTADDYNPSQEFLDKLSERFHGVNLSVELEKFRDHHAAKGSKFDVWDRAFQRWVRQASEWSPEAKQIRARQEAEAEWERFKREIGEDS
jgi:hypothetical protein